MSQDDAPRRSGSTWVLGRELISNTASPQAGTVLNWQGVNFTPQAAAITVPVTLPEFCRHESEVVGVICLRTLDGHGECPVHGKAIT